MSSFKINVVILWPVTLEGHTAGFRFIRVQFQEVPVRQRGRPPQRELHFLFFRHRNDQKDQHTKVQSNMKLNDSVCVSVHISIKYWTKSGLNVLISDDLFLWLTDKTLKCRTHGQFILTLTLLDSTQISWLLFIDGGRWRMLGLNSKRKFLTLKTLDLCKSDCWGLIWSSAEP